MRRNAFDDYICHNSFEIAAVLADKGVQFDEIHAEFSFDEDEDGWGGEIRDNESGDTVLYFEGFSTAHETIVTLTDAGLAAGDITEL